MRAPKPCSCVMRGREIGRRDELSVGVRRIRRGSRPSGIVRRMLWLGYRLATLSSVHLGLKGFVRLTLYSGARV